MRRREFLYGLTVVWLAGLRISRAAQTNGQRLADAARAQLGVTTGYDPTWTKLRYPNGDVPRSTGVCADVVIRAARDGLGLDLQRLVHEDMTKAFDAYPARKAWGSRVPDTSIDHRRVLNLEAYWARAGARLWAADAVTAGDAFPHPIEVGDIVTWLLDARLPHVGVVISAGQNTQVVHNIGRGVEQVRSRRSRFTALRATIAGPGSRERLPFPTKSTSRCRSADKAASSLCETSLNGF